MGSGARVILVPSICDAHHDFVFPQPPCDIRVVDPHHQQFVKVLSLEGTKEGEVKCMCVNPGRLARGEGGGQFLELNFDGNPDSSSASVIRI
ncbi:hypothetical protein CTI12_AA097060 [Artemisia annua]|uniref:Uncharacterized protein n=1 Tax=Artemisia annua TaxID=35608 RepID=A0A2U1PYD6_ARTAN|nr:hypothetical protein CTI12_AA097060 [Artemisia annua]